jgi:hypothetical protein
MAKVQANKEYNTFVQGLVTERTPLTFPENASLDENNFVLLRDGSRKRRFGMDQEVGGVLTDTGKTASDLASQIVSSHIWENADREGLQDILVIQIGLDLYFFDANKDVLSSSLLNGGAAVTLSGSEIQEITTASIFGKLIIANNNKGFYVLSYDPDTDTISTETRNILVRDIWGVDDGMAVNERIKTLNFQHEYNLINQGWGAQNPDVDDPYYIDTRQVEDDAWKSKYPSNADLVQSGKDPTDGNRYRADQVARTYHGANPAPKGFCIIDAFRRGQARGEIIDGKSFVGENTSLSGDPFALSKFIVNTPIWKADRTINSYFPFPQDSTEGGIKAVEAFAGRLWAAGATSKTVGADSKSPNLGAYVFFSQAIDSSSKINQFYAEGDPTSEFEFDPLETDGGVVRIPDASNINKLIAVGRSIFVFAQNGVWEISGGETNFSAINLEIRKVTNIGSISSKTVIEVEGAVFYWATSGIYLITPDRVSGYYSSQNITETSIQTFYNDIPNTIKASASAVFDSVDRKVRWLYKDPEDTTPYDFKYNKELVFDLVLKSYYVNTIYDLDANTPFVSGFVKIPPFNTVIVTNDVVVNGDPVEVNADQVTVTGLDRVASTASSVVRYLCLFPDTTYSIGFGGYTQEDYKDWYSSDFVGKDAEAYLLTGYETLGDTQRNKQATYITVHMKPESVAYDYRWNIEEVQTTSIYKEIASPITPLDGFSLNPDGTRFYTVDNQITKQFDLATPFDISSIITSSFVSEASLTTASQCGLIWSTDGLHAYYIGLGDQVYQYDVSTPFDITGWTYIGSWNPGFVGASHDSGMAWKVDGTVLYIYDNVDAGIYQMPVPDPWNVTSIISGWYDTENYDFSDPLFRVNVGGFGSTFRGDMNFKPDGSRLFMAFYSWDWDTGNVDVYRVYQFDMTRPWDVTTITEKNLLLYEGTYYDIPWATTEGANTFYISQWTEPTGEWMYTFQYDDSGIANFDTIRQYRMPWSDKQPSCLLTAQWDFADDAQSNKFGSEQQVYRPRRYFLTGDSDLYGQAVVSSKSKIRGRGKALSLLFKTEANKDCHIYGWGVDYSGVSGA